MKTWGSEGGLQKVYFQYSCLHPNVVLSVPKMPPKLVLACNHAARSNHVTAPPLTSGLFKSKCKAKTHYISSKGVCNNQNRPTAIINNSKVSEFPHNRSSFLAGAPVQCCSGVVLSSTITQDPDSPRPSSSSGGQTEREHGGVCTGFPKGQATGWKWNKWLAPSLLCPCTPQPANRKGGWEM